MHLTPSGCLARELINTANVVAPAGAFDRTVLHALSGVLVRQHQDAPLHADHVVVRAAEPIGEGGRPPDA